MDTALSQPLVSHHEGSQTNGVTVGRPITGRTSGRPIRTPPFAAPPLACGITVGRSACGTRGSRPLLVSKRKRCCHRGLYLLVCTIVDVDTKTRLVESAQELLWERGYAATSPKAIQARAGAGQGSMYHHFAGKSDLALTALRSTAEQFRASVETSLSGSGSAYVRLIAYLNSDRDVLRGCRIGGLTQDPDVAASPELREPVEATFAWLRSRLAAVVVEAQDSGELALGLDPSATASTLAAVIQGGYVLARAAGSAEPFDQAVNGALALLATARLASVR